MVFSWPMTAEANLRNTRGTGENGIPMTFR
jgi:hypothetical protein